ENDLAAEVAIGDRRDDARDAAHLVGQVSGHQVHAVGQVLPGSRDPFDLRLAAQVALRTDLTGDARDLRGKRVQLIDHDVDRVFQLADLAADLDGDLLGQIALGDGGCDLRDVAHVGGQIARHVIDVVGQVLPDTNHACDLRLAAEASLGPHFAGDP